MKSSCVFRCHSKTFFIVDYKEPFADKLAVVVLVPKRFHRKQELGFLRTPTFLFESDIKVRHHDVVTTTVIRCSESMLKERI